MNLFKSKHLGLVVLIFLVFPLSGFSAQKLKKNSPKTPDSPVDVLIVGAGLTGLSTAYHLKKAGLTYKILEMSPHLGGRIKTVRYVGGASAEAGLEEFWEQNPTLQIIKELNLPIEKSVASFSSFVYQGKIFPFTQKSNSEFVKSIFSPEELKAFKTWDEKAILLQKQIQERKMDSALLALKEISFGKWVQNDTSLTTKIREFIRIQSEPEYATSWENISALDGLAEWHIFSGLGSQSFHIKGGNQLLPEAIGKYIGLKTILFNQRVSKIRSSANKVEVTSIDTGTFEESLFSAKFVVTTFPLFRTGEVQFEPPLSQEKLQAMQTQTWGSYFTAHVFVDSKARKFWNTEGQTILPILSDGPLGVIYGENSGQSKSPSQSYLLNLLITGANAEKLNFRAVSMDDVKTQLSEALDKQWPGIRSMLRSFEFFPYHPRAIASWPVGRSRFDTLSDHLRLPQGRVYFAGDFTEGTHSDGAAKSSIRVSNQILRALLQKEERH